MKIRIELEPTRWDKLSMRDRAKYIHLSILNHYANGGSMTDVSIDDIRHRFDEGGYSVGNLVNAIYERPNIVEELPAQEPIENYNNVNLELLKLLLSDERGHYDDSVKLPNHPTHPSRGTFEGLFRYNLTDRGMKDPNYSMFGMVDGGLDPLATLLYKDGIVLPEITVTSQGNYFHDTYNNIKIHDDGGTLIHQYGDGSILDGIKNVVKKIPFAVDIYKMLTSPSEGSAPAEVQPSTIEEVLPKYAKAVEGDNNFVDKRIEIDKTYTIPYIPEKKMVVNGAVFSSNALDSIAKHAAKAGMPMEEALKPFVLETKMGAFEPYTLVRAGEYVQRDTKDASLFPFAYGMTPTELTNDHNYFISPIRGEMNYPAKVKSGPLSYGSPYIRWGKSPDKVNEELQYGTNFSTAVSYNGTEMDKEFLSTLDNRFKIEEALTPARIAMLLKLGDKEVNQDPYTHIFNLVRNHIYAANAESPSSPANKEWDRVATAAVLEFMKSPAYLQWLKTRTRYSNSTQ